LANRSAPPKMPGTVEGPGVKIFYSPRAFDHLYPDSPDTPPMNGGQRKVLFSTTR
jgi:hypothetical protein